MVNDTISVTVLSAVQAAKSKVYFSRVVQSTSCPDFDVNVIVRALRMLFPNTLFNIKIDYYAE